MVRHIVETFWKDLHLQVRGGGPALVGEAIRRFILFLSWYVSQIVVCNPFSCTQRGYNLVYSPHIAKLDLWKTSGHFDFYKENMYDQMAVSENIRTER